MADAGGGERQNEKSFDSNDARNASGVKVISGDCEGDKRGSGCKQGAVENMSTTEYCRRLQGWMWQYYSGYVGWLSWASAPPFFAFPPFVPPPQLSASSEDPGVPDPRLFPFFMPSSFAASPGSGTASREFSIPSPLQRFVAEMVDFFILFFIKATIILSIMHLSGMKDISKFAMHFIVEEIDEDTSMEELQKMMLVALIYRILIICIWGAGGATPGKFLLGLRVVTCDTAVLVRPNRVLVVPASNVKFSASTVRALNKNFSIALFFPAFITLLFFQHNRTVYDIVAGTIVVKRNGAR
ncbi:protein FAM8A1-like [Scleropages formosus]|uniref:Protein FAM8A1-like n=1 Tax=Scleropages formosus TaxID=113540 RepID=A0A0P7TE47_SCLFO|nr:protein FAM8A1-like [Scleropages formosus]